MKIPQEFTQPAPKDIATETVTITLVHREDGTVGTNVGASLLSFVKDGVLLTSPLSGGLPRERIVQILAQALVGVSTPALHQFDAENPPEPLAVAVAKILR